MYESILVPLDGSHRAERILAHVEQLASQFGSQLILLRVVEPDLSGAGNHAMSADFYLDAFDRAVQEARDYLSALQGEFRRRSIQVRVLVERGPVVGTIIGIAHREAADLVAMASHGRGGLSQFFYGSVAVGVLHRIDLPLLLVRAVAD